MELTTTAGPSTSEKQNMTNNKTLAQLLQEISLQNEDKDIQLHALDLIRDFGILEELKLWAEEIMRCDESEKRIQALETLRKVGDLAFKRKTLSPSLFSTSTTNTLLATSRSRRDADCNGPGPKHPSTVY